MSEPFVGEIRAFGFNYPPMDWAQCNGQSIPMAQYNALYALIGTRYGTAQSGYFVLPNLMGRVALGQGAGPGLTPRTLAQKGGSETVTLTMNTGLPSHRHDINCDASADPESVSPINNYISSDGATQVYKKEINPQLECQMAPTAVSSSGLGAAHQNRQPTLTMNYCIALVGLWPEHQ